MKPYARSTWNLYTPGSKQPYKISRSKVDLFSECRRCMWIEARYGVRRPSMPAFTLNNAVDELLKREYDIYRAKKEVHPAVKGAGLDLIPFEHEKLEEWRDAMKRGIMYHHEESNILLRGGIDDVWTDQDGTLYIVDYKATSKLKAPSTESDLYDSYKRQVEVYQWLFRQNDFTVSDTAYFVYVNGKQDADALNEKLEFETNLIAYTGDDSWVAPTLLKIRDTLESNDIPPIGTAFGGGPCEHCSYRELAGTTFRDHVRAHPRSHHGK